MITTNEEKKTIFQASSYLPENNDTPVIYHWWWQKFALFFIGHKCLRCLVQSTSLENQTLQQSLSKITILDFNKKFIFTLIN